MHHGIDHMVGPSPFPSLPPGHQTWGPTLLVMSDGDHWRPVQTCSFGDIPPLPPPPTGMLSCSRCLWPVHIAREWVLVSISAPVSDRSV